MPSAPRSSDALPSPPTGWVTVSPGPVAVTVAPGAELVTLTRTVRPLMLAPVIAIALSKPPVVNDHVCVNARAPLPSKWATFAETVAV